MDLNEIYKVTKDSRREEFEVAFEKIKKDFIRQQSKKCEKPLFILAGGQPGSGKTGIIETIKNSHRDREFIVIDQDEYRKYHPNFKEIREKYPQDAVTLTNEFVFEIENEMLSYVKKNKIDTINVSTLRNTSLILKSIEEIRECGFKIEVYVIAVSAEESYFSTLTRYQEQEKDMSEVPRFVSKDFHDISYKSLMNTIENFERINIPITVLKRAKEKKQPAIIVDRDKNVIDAIENIRKDTKNEAIEKIKNSKLNFHEKIIQLEYEKFLKEIGE